MKCLVNCCSMHLCKKTCTSPFMNLTKKQNNNNNQYTLNAHENYFSAACLLYNIP